MPEYMYALADTLLSFSTDELVGALLIGLVLAIGMSGLYTLLRRRSTDTFSLLSGLIFVACLLSMALAAEHSGRPPKPGQERLSENELWMRQAQEEARAAVPTSHLHEGPGTGAPPADRARGRFERYGPPPLGDLLLRAADVDMDGRLSPDEAARYVRGVNKGGEGGVGARDIDDSLRKLMGPRPGSDPARTSRSTPHVP